ncbi:Transcriptional activator spt7-like protein [Penicillium ucsense]|uniref:SAGA complex subunit Spt7 n=1 Tax=Penicillium ucsense TaxID=2839758 RepID=A0A8J8VZN3_9EURO|nr:Transcriptional activator spt7-like protein [Penicillium ucsense]KAF7734242.1 Transcriptional activator spt7-like protein [Penicillium ucsense]
MSLGHHAWPPGNVRPPDEHQDLQRPVNGFVKTLSGSRTPQTRGSISAEGPNPGSMISEPDMVADEDPRIAQFREMFRISEAKINALFLGGLPKDDAGAADLDSGEPSSRTERVDAPVPPPKAPATTARKLDDDYDDYDDDDDEEDTEMRDAPAPPTKSKSNPPSQGTVSAAPSVPRFGNNEGAKEVKKESAEDIRKKLEQDKKATEEAVKHSFHTMFYTLEDDRYAMLDQKRLEESERQVEAEMAGQNTGNNTAPGDSNGHGSLSQTNLGASSLTLKNLLARIDQKRDMVAASDAELRNLIREVRKNRSKWYNEDRIGQEELYDAAEKVLNELKAMTENSAPFLNKVNKRDVPDYHLIIRHPMDLGTMTKKLKAISYKSKQEFVDDINLIWANCLKYNTDPNHQLRRKALVMRKETDKLVPLIPDIVIRDRAEVEAEERRAQLAELEDGGEESDDEPIMSSRGRKAPGKKTSQKGTAPSRSTPSGSEGPAGTATSQPAGPVRADSDTAMEASQNGLTTPPHGSNTPSDPAGPGAGAVPSQLGDSMEIDGQNPDQPALSALSAAGGEFEDPEYKVWKQVTKKDRALIAAERHRLLKGDKLNPDEPALLRTKAGMRRWLRHEKQAAIEGEKTQDAGPEGIEPEATGASLAEGIEVEEDKMIPYYYDVMHGVPDLPARTAWKEDADGNIMDTSEEYLRVLPPGSFTQPDSKLSRKIDSNMRQMQDTRKICSKIGIVKQMQLQAQMYANQFQKYNPEPFIEQDIPPHVMNDEGPVMTTGVCRAALQRSVAKIFYHAGFEEYQPSAIEVATDVAADYFHKLGQTIKSYMETPKVPVNETEDPSSTTEWKRAYSEPEVVLHTLAAVGMDIEELELYIKDDVERLGSKLTSAHDRLKYLFTELLRPALTDVGEDGSKAFADGSDQFVTGTFADDINDDFLGFKELGLDVEFGIAFNSVPLHLLPSRMFNAAQAQNTTAIQTEDLFPPPPPYARITIENVGEQIGLVQQFLKGKLDANGDEPLVEDLELPPKQRPMPAKTRLPASGKIPAPTGVSGNTSSPQKRPAPPNAPVSKVGPMEPSKKKAKKNSGGPLDMPGFPEGDADSMEASDLKDLNPPMDGAGMPEGETSATQEDPTTVPLTNGTSA